MDPISFVKTQWATVPEVEKMDLSGRNIIITGSNTGLGLEAAKHFARMNPARVILAVRSIEKGQAAKQKIVEAVPEAEKIVQVWKLDMGSFQSINDFAARVNKDLDRLDIALLNAGVAHDSWSQSDGYETTIMVNDIGTTLLALLLLPKLEETAEKPALSTAPNFKPHLTLTGSEVHFMTKLPEAKGEHPVEALNDKSKFNAGDRYNASKLINIYMARELGKRAKNSVVTNVVNPGLCWSELARDGGFLSRVVMYTMRTALARPTEVGSRTLVWAATHDTPPGAYSTLCAVGEESAFSRSEEGLEQQRKVWADLIAIAKEKSPEARKLL